MIYRDRTEAGRFLADRLEHFADEDPIVLGLPRGGVPVAYEVARALDAPLDVLISRKLGAPYQPEFGFGAVARDVVVLDRDSVEMLGLSSGQISEIVERERQEAGRREHAFREGRPPLDVQGRTVIVVDDGLATGVTARAACRALRELGPRKIVFAAPVCAGESATMLRDFADEVHCGYVPARFMAVGQWYEVFDQTTDEEVIRLLARAHAERQPSKPAGSPEESAERRA